MAYNHGREDRKWRIWKEAEEKLLRECGVDEATIEQIRISCRGLWMLTESFGRSTTENHSGRDKQVPAVKDCRFTQTAFGTVVHDSRGKWLGQYETEDAAVEMLREMAKDDGGYSDEI